MIVYTRDWGTVEFNVDGMVAISGDYRYSMGKFPRYVDEETLANLVPAPTAETNGAVLRFLNAYGDAPNTIGDHIVARVIEAPKDADPELCEVGGYYVLKDFGSAAAIERPVAPKFRLVAIDETAHWNPEVTAVTGKIQSVYLYDENQHVHLCELTPSHWLQFLYNVSENAVGDRDSDPEDNLPMIPKFDSVTEFEYENGGEAGTYWHVSDIRRIDNKFKYDCGEVDPRDLEEYQCAPEAVREKYYENLVKDFHESYDCNRCFEGHFEPKTQESAPQP